MTRVAIALVTVAFIGTTPSHAAECWIASDVKGYSAVSDLDYRFVENGLSSPLLICFTADGGTVSGSDIRLVRFGESTLAGYGGNDEGNEVFVVYQIDRDNGKLLFTLTRIGTKTITTVLPDLAEAFVGNVVQAP